jgi:MFS family permease
MPTRDTKDGTVPGMNPEAPRFGLRANWGQFVVLSLITFWVGAVVGVERVVVPALGASVFHLTSYIVLLSFIVSFGFVKAAVNLVGGGAADRIGRRPVLVVGWLFALPVPFLLLTAPNWWWVVAANALVGINQGLAWSMAVTSKIDLAGRRQRGFAMGLNEFSGYAGVSVGGFLGGVLSTVAFRTAPYELLLGVILVGLVASFLAARETQDHVRQEEVTRGRVVAPGDVVATSNLKTVFSRASWKDRRLAACSQAGLIEKFVDTMAWGLFPLYLVGQGLPLVSVGVVTGVYTGSWAALQLVFGPLSDHMGRKWLIVVGMIVAGLGVLGVGAFATWTEEILSALVAGTGMAMLYPTLLAAVADLSPPADRAATLGVYRFWRDSGYGFGGLAIGAVADVFGFRSTFLFAAVLMSISALLFAWALRDSEPSERTQEIPTPVSFPTQTDRTQEVDVA